MLNKLFLCLFLITSCVSIYLIVKQANLSADRHLPVIFTLMQVSGAAVNLIGSICFIFSIMFNSWIMAISGFGIYIISYCLNPLLDKLSSHEIKKHATELKQINSQLPKNAQISNLSHYIRLAEHGKTEALMQVHAKYLLGHRRDEDEYIHLASIVGYSKSQVEQILNKASNGDISQFNTLDYKIAHLDKDIRQGHKLLDVHPNSLHEQAKIEAQLAKNPVYIKAAKMACHENGLDYNKVQHAMHEALHGHPAELQKIDIKLNQDKNINETIQNATHKDEHQHHKN